VQTLDRALHGVAGMSAAESVPAKTWVERALSPIADVRREEIPTALLMTVLMFLVLGAYYMLKTAREMFILTEGGAEVKSYSSAGQAILLLVLVPAYAAFASRVNRGRLVTWVPLFFAANLVLFILAAQAGVHVGIVFFIWIGIFNVMVIAQFWAFANDIYTQEQGKRLFPLIGVGSSLGAWVGSMRAGDLVQASGPTRLLVGGGLLLVICAGIAATVNRMAVRHQHKEQIARAESPLGTEGAFALIRKDRYLLLIAFMTVVLNVVNTSGEYLFGRYVVEQSVITYGAGPETAALRERFVGDVYGRLFSTVNLIGFLLQMFVVSRVFKVLGIGRALLIHPIVALTGYLLMLRAPSLQLMGVVKVADNSLDYSLGNTVKQALWLPTNREAKYKAKQAVDSFFVRVGDVIQAGIVFGGERLAMTVPAFAALNVVLAAGWVGIAVALNATRARRESVAAIVPEPR
jgi:AAA family ATP:ADP antiporter